MSVGAAAPPPPPFSDPDRPPADYHRYPSDFDMIDTEEELEHWVHLRDRLEVCGMELRDCYERCNNSALKHQIWHRNLANSAALFGTAAVMLAVFQLAFPELVEELKVWRIPLLEIVSAVAAAFAVAVGLGVVGKSQWLLKRHEAERLRLLKFRFLLDPNTWNANAQQNTLRDDLQGKTRKVLDLTPHAFEEWAEELGPLLPPASPHSCPLVDEPLRQLVEYYRAKRLVYQRKYFQSRVRRYVPLSFLTGWLAPTLFFASVAAVLVHFGLDVWAEGTSNPAWNHVFLFAAALLPVAGAGIRTLVAAHEFGRNKVRYRAKEVVLGYTDEHLRNAVGADDKLREMEFCEQTLELEHLEWSRLMTETEVFP